MQALQYISTVPSPVLPYLFMDCPMFLHDPIYKVFLSQLFSVLVLKTTYKSYSHYVHFFAFIRKFNVYLL